MEFSEEDLTRWIEGLRLGQHEVLLDFWNRMSPVLEHGPLRFSYSLRDIREWPARKLLDSSRTADYVLAILAGTADGSALVREILDGSEVTQLIKGQTLAPQAPRETPGGGVQQVIRPDSGRRVPGLNEGSQPA